MPGLPPVDPDIYGLRVLQTQADMTTLIINDSFMSSNYPCISINTMVRCQTRGLLGGLCCGPPAWPAERPCAGVLATGTHKPLACLARRGGGGRAAAAISTWPPDGTVIARRTPPGSCGACLSNAGSLKWQADG